jgi:uncharacterized protein (TIGR02594 family)
VFKELAHVVTYTKYRMRMIFLLTVSFLAACDPQVFDPVTTAQPYIGLQERHDRTTIREFVGVDPVRTEWCAAFVNAILEVSNIPGSASVSDHPLMARSFLEWGEPVEVDQIQRGDVVVFPRGSASWQGHVGFYIQTETHNNHKRWIILGGNQNNQVRYESFDPGRAIAIRRHKPLVAIEQMSTSEHLNTE